MALKRRPPEKHGERRSSARKRRQKENQLDRDLKGTRWEKKDDQDS